jgi:hypothetical protein
MENEIDSQADAFVDVQLNLDTIDSETMYLVMRHYIERNMSPASLSKFDDMLAAATEEESVSLEEAVAVAVFNDAVIQVIESQLAADSGVKPIPPFNI